MATLTATSLQGSGSRLATVNTLTASDTFTYTKGSGQILYIDNVTAGALTINIDGDGGTTVPVGGIGSVSVTSGYTLPSLAAGASTVIPLDSIFAYLQGTIAMTGGDAAEAVLMNP